MRKILVLTAALFAIALAVFFAKSAAEASAPLSMTEAADAACNGCHAGGNLAISLPSGEKMSLKVDPTLLAGSVHRQLACTSCHQTLTGYPHPPSDIPSVREYQLSREDLCWGCHADKVAEMQESVHRKDVSRPDVATCADCHGAHDVQAPAAAATRLGSVTACNGCHANERLMDRYGISTGVIQAFYDDFHGKTVALAGLKSGAANVEVAVCADCHGAHNILRADAAGSMVAAANLPDTCGRCHEGANANFTSAWLSHREPDLGEAPLVFLARWFYRIMIPFIVVGLLAHVILDARRARRKGEAK
ncbi:MAG: hypothetical protein HYX96_08310 [Chloroflexi bacterium]|nr:hypothetical protein [Chloroflexota bacterium]